MACKYITVYLQFYTLIMFYTHFKVISLFVLLMLLVSFWYVYANEQEFNEAKLKIDSIRLTDPNLPTTVSDQKGSVWYIISRLFDTDGKISTWFLRWFQWLTDNSVAVWNSGNGWGFINGSILDDGTNVGIWTAPVNNRKLNVAGDINLSWDLYQNWSLFSGWKFIDGTNTNNAVYLVWNVGIGKQPSQALDVNGNIQATAFLYTSDERKKTNITSYTQGKNIINNINTYTYDWKKSGQSDIGVIAQEVQKIFPEAVQEGTDWYLAVDYVKLIVPLIQTVQDQQFRIESQLKRIQDLELYIKKQN